SNTSRFPFNSHCSPAQSPPKHCRKPVLSSRTYEAVPNLRQVLDCASPLALWNGAVRTPAKPSTSPLPPSSILNPLSSVFIQASILPQTISQSVTYGSFDTIFFFEGVFDPFRTKNEKRRIHQTPVFIDPNDAFCLIFKICKKTAFFEGSKNSFFTITQTLPKSATTSAARSALEC